MKKMIIISFLIFSMLSARQLMVNTHEIMSTKAAHSLNKNVRTNNNSAENNTNIINKNVGNNNSSLLRFFINILKNLFAISPDKAAETILFLLKEDSSIDVTGKYFVKCKEKRTSKISYNEKISNQIWNISYKYIEKYLS